MQKSLLSAVIALLLGVLIWLLFVWRPVPQPAVTQPLAEAPKGGDFSLQGPRGPVSLSDFRGQVVILYFGYTWCPDICPTTLALFSQVLNELEPAELSQVQPIFVSVDPRRDNLARLQEYTEYFHRRLLGITGSDAEVAQAAALYGVAYRAVNPETDENYAVDHSADTYLIDQQGSLLQRLPHGSSAESLLKAVRGLLSGEAQENTG
ncbi:MAG: SCO family protein [Chromatiales bacterium]|jgi:protein SCO1/2